MAREDNYHVTKSKLSVVYCQRYEQIIMGDLMIITNPIAYLMVHDSLSPLLMLAIQS